MHSQQAKPVTALMRRVLLVASVLVFIVGIQLFIFTEDTARYFAWTIATPLTAAFLGAAYWASFVLEYLASREKLWARARIAVPAVLLFTALTFIVTLVHLDKFHLGSSFELLTQILTWVWVGVYLSVPVIMGLILLGQLRQPGQDQARQQPTPLWVSGTFGLYGVLLLLLGLGLLIAPQSLASAWPWALTPLTGSQASIMAQRGIGLGIASLHVVFERDWARIFPAMAGFVLFAVLELVAVARYPTNLSWTTPVAWLYVILLTSMALVGAYGPWQSWKARQ